MFATLFIDINERRKMMADNSKPKMASKPNSIKLQSSTSEDCEQVFSNPKSTSKTTVVEETGVTAKMGTEAKTSDQRKDKKVYILPGQKHEPPQEREPLRIFYSTLYQQIPSSEMAEIWMMKHGLLSPQKAKAVFEKNQRRQQQAKFESKPETKKVGLSNESKPEKRKGDLSGETKSNKKKGDLTVETKPKKKGFLSDDDDDFCKPWKKHRMP